MGRKALKPTLTELNELTASQAMLVVLRGINTSDLAHMYMLFAPNTLRDIKYVAYNLFKEEHKHNVHELTKAEIEEYAHYLKVLEGYAMDWRKSQERIKLHAARKLR
jgi:hypothetical protein